MRDCVIRFLYQFCILISTKRFKRVRFDFYRFIDAELLIIRYLRTFSDVTFLNESILNKKLCEGILVKKGLFLVTETRAQFIDCAFVFSNPTCYFFGLKYNTQEFAENAKLAAYWQ